VTAASGTGKKARPTLPDVAAKAGVSVGTVSHVLNHPDRVSERTREKVLAAIADLGFSRNSIASALASGKTRTVGLVVPTLRNSIFVDIADGAQRTAKAHGFMLQLASCDSDLSQQEAHLDFLDGARVTGLLLAPMQDSHGMIERLRRHGRPVVVLNFVSSSETVCTVVVDNERAGYLATRHLIELGRRQIAFVASRFDLQPVVLRRQGAERALAEAGGEVRLTDITVDALDPAAGALAGRQIVASRRGRPDGVLAVTDALGLGVIDALIGAQVSVPHDIAVIGCDHDTGAWGGAIPLSTVAMRGQSMGSCAVELLMEEIGQRDDHRHREIALEPELLLRESTIGR
jgi:LacI family transcriptional regulator